MPAVPVVFKFIAIATIWSFPITRERQELIQRRLERRQAQTACVGGRHDQFQYCFASLVMFWTGSRVSGVVERQ